ncbi:hypothetical protein ACQ4PT_067882 [Festuca glaucescens]
MADDFPPRPRSGEGLHRPPALRQRRGICGGVPEAECRRRRGAELCVSRRAGWELRRLPLRHGKVKRDDLWLWGWQPDAAVAVGGRYLCWGDLSCGIVLWDALADGPELQYVSPALGRASSAGVAGAASTRSTGDPGACASPERALKTEDMTWWQDGEMDAAELWALPGYCGLPRVPVEYPVVSMDEPGVLCLLLCEDHHDGRRDDGDGTVWLIEVDTARKVLRSVARYDERFRHEAFLPSEVSKHFGSHPRGIINGVAAAAGGVHETTTNAAYPNRLPNPSAPNGRGSNNRANISSGVSSEASCRAYGGTDTSGHI